MKKSKAELFVSNGLLDIHWRQLVQVWGQKGRIERLRAWPARHVEGTLR